ncbi:MAG TPA: AmmeMemoRadiSam system radical SAM enzyme [Thermoplasmataceae archaeon]|nr:AmmeMemoRadiSam system radical SAM enzyme [Thermoplasmataceae archaeon]
MGVASLFSNLDSAKVRCTACRRYCTLKPGQIGFCGVRKNVDGVLHLLVQNRPLAIQIDPIEKKPVLHMYPNYVIYSIGTAGCDFACQFCQNFDISQRREVTGVEMIPEELVREARSLGCDGFAYTYNEPTIFSEFAKEIGDIAHRYGMINIFVTNGYETPESVKYVSSFLDSATVDFKGNASPDFYRRIMSVPDVSLIYDTIDQFRKYGVHTEITDLVVPGIGDSEDEARSMVRRVIDIMGDDVPISFLRFHPDYKLMNLPPTPVETLVRHYRIAKEEGAKFVYIGNVPGSDLQNTYCPGCGLLLVKRDMMHTLRVNLTNDSRCPNCGYRTNIVLGKPRIRQSAY